MLNLSVQQFMGHLPAEQQGPVLRNQEAFLAFLRLEFRRNDRSKRALVEAATHYAERRGVTVHCLASERFAAKALVYVYMRLGDELIRRGKVTKPKSHLKISRCEPAKPAPQSATTRFRTVETVVNGRRERISQYPADITWAEAKGFQHDPLYDLPDIDLEPEVIETGETAHFERSSRPSGWGTVLIDGEAAGRVRCWEGA